MGIVLRDCSGGFPIRRVETGAEVVLLFLSFLDGGLLGTFLWPTPGMNESFLPFFLFVLLAMHWKRASLVFLFARERRLYMILLFSSCLCQSLIYISIGLGHLYFFLARDIDPTIRFAI